MGLEKLIQALYRVLRGAVRWFSRLSAAIVGNTIPNGSAQPGADAPPENKPVKPYGEDSTSKPTAGKPGDPESLSNHQDTLPKNTAASRTHKKPEKAPQPIGGARGPGKGRKSPVKQRLLPEAKPELICREVPAHNHWKIFLILPQDQEASVSQGESRLLPNNSGEYPLLNFSGTLTVQVTDNAQNKTIKLTDGTSLLIFKLRKNWQGYGRKVRHVSNGYYVVFAPRTWQRKGEAPVEHSGSADSEFSAHYFFADGNSEADGFDECSSFFQKRRFSLEGEAVIDDSDMGDLFVGKPLDLIDTTGNNWPGISWIRIGEEGGNKWSKNFKPAKDEENLATVLGNREGWFYVRIYDEDVKMIDGFDFRRLVNLEAIRVNENIFSPENIIVPTTDGHTATTIQFAGKIQVESDNLYITVGENNTAIIDPNPDTDKTQWTLIGTNGQAEVRIHLPRIWWRMDNTGDAASEWRDTAFEMSREEFRSNREAVMIVRLPSVARKICVGLDSFNQYDGAREYPARHNKNDNTQQAEFKLREFCNLRQISEYSSRKAALQIQCGEAVCTLIRIPADAPPPRPEPEQMPISPPEVCNSTQKGFFRPATKNKRFSRSELHKSGLTIDQAKQLRIAVDRRRTTRHRANTDRLKNIQQGENHAD